MAVEILEHFKTINDVGINYGEIPSGARPLVLLHGGSARWQSYDRIMPELAANWHIYTPDFRGHGKSARTTGHYRLQDYANDVIAFLKEVVKEPTFLFGLSLGGIVAVMVTAQYPQGVKALVVGDAPLSQETWRAAMGPQDSRLLAQRKLSGGQIPMEQVIEGLKDTPLEKSDGSMGTFREVFGEDWVGWTSFATDIYQNDPDMLAAVMERLEDTSVGYDMERLLPAIRCPVLLMQADPQAGGMMTDAEVEQGMKLLAHPSHVKLMGVSHAMHHQKPREVVRVMRKFLVSL